MYIPLIVFELLTQLLAVNVITCLQAEELEVVNFSQLGKVLHVLARVACYLVVLVITCCAETREGLIAGPLY